MQQDAEKAERKLQLVHKWVRAHAARKESAHSGPRPVAGAAEQRNRESQKSRETRIRRPPPGTINAQTHRVSDWRTKAQEWIKGQARSM
jgi:hypothetical protein